MIQILSWIVWAESVLEEYMTEYFDITKLNKNKEYIVDVMECVVERPKIQEIQSVKHLDIILSKP